MTFSLGEMGASGNRDHPSIDLDGRQPQREFPRRMQPPAGLGGCYLLCASVASNRSPTLAERELISEPTRTVIELPAGMVCAVTTSASNMSTETILNDFPSMRSSFSTNPWQYYAGAG